MEVFMPREGNPDIHVMHPDVVDEVLTIPDATEIVMGYTVGKDEKGIPNTIDPESVDCYAKQVLIYIDDEPRTTFFVKTGLNGQLYDPWGIFTEGTQHKEAKHMGRPVWQFKQVEEDCFCNYTKYLMTRNRAFLLNAERV
jgi:hypothetical protein